MDDVVYFKRSGKRLMDWVQKNRPERAHLYRKVACGRCNRQYVIFNLGEDEPVPVCGQCYKAESAAG